MSKIIDAIEAKQKELEQRKQDIKQAVDNALSESRQNMIDYIIELQQTTEQNMTELQRQHEESLKRQVQKIKRSYQIQLTGLWIVILTILTAFGAVIWANKRTVEEMEYLDHRQQWLWLVNEEAIKAEIEKRRENKPNKK